MVINSPCLTDKKELAIPGQTATGKEFSNPLMAEPISSINCSMADLKFVDQHNMVACLENSDDNLEFHQIVDFLSSCFISYALTVSPTIYASYIEQFWNTATSKTVNKVKQINAIVNDKAVVISESSVRSDLLLDDEDGITCLTNAEIFENLALMGYEQISTKLTFQKGSFSPQWKFLIHTILHCISSKSTGWNEFYTNLASAVICLAKGIVTPLFATMLVQNQAPEGEGSEIPPESQPTPSTTQPFVSESQPASIQTETPILPSPTTYQRKRKTHKRRKTQKDTELPQTSVPQNLGADEAVHQEEGDSVERAITTDASLDATQDSDNIFKTQFTIMPNVDIPQGMDTSGNPRRQDTMGDMMKHTFELTESVPPTPRDSPLPGGYTPRSDEGRLKLQELMVLCTKLTKRVLDLQKGKDAQDVEILKLKQRVNKLERHRKSSISHPRRRTYRQVESSDDDLDEEDASKQGRNKDKTKPMFKESDFKELHDDMQDVQEETVDATTFGVSTVSTPVTTAGVTISTAEPRTPPSTTTIFDDEDVTMAMAQTLIKMKEQKAKEKGVAITDVEDSSQTIRPVRSIITLKPLPNIDPKDKGNGVLVEEEPRKFRATQRAAKIRSKPPTKTQLRNMMMTYLKNMGKFTHSQLKGKSYEDLQRLYEREQKWINDFVPMNSEKEEKKKEELESERRPARGSRRKTLARKRIGHKQSKESAKRQKLDDAVERDNEEETADYEQEELRIFPILDFEYQLLEKMEAKEMDVYKLTRADGSSSYHESIQAFLRRLDRQDLNNLYSLVQERFRDHPLEGNDLLLWGDLRMIFEPDENNEL
ncbi:hypothetical protein Tco_0611336 [Tanacetum coccineum]